MSTRELFFVPAMLGLECVYRVTSGELAPAPGYKKLSNQLMHKLLFNISFVRTVPM